MNKIQKLFNFDNIGEKIKNLSKWTCWITILLLWIAAPIVIIVAIAEEAYAAIILAPIAALIASFVVWIGSWAMFAFGEFVENTRDNEYNTSQILAKLMEDSNNHTTTEEANQEEIIEDDEPQEHVPSHVAEERKRKIARIADLRKKGLISEELYQNAINNPKVLDKF